jgi:2-dehydro-3-deoxyphosphogluconate aldolase/(4S)-4-hydroxy-2-oxoglutarate aldolase
MHKSSLNVQKFIESGILAIIRIDRPDDVMPTVEALANGGIEFIEISLVTPHAIDYIAQVHEQFGDAVRIGAGTVLDSESARSAILAGADFVVSPNTSVETISMARRYGKLIFSGAFTPTECLLAWESGADFVKVFPANPAGPEYIKAIHAPLPQIPLVPVGGITLENLPGFIKSGACGVAAATSLVNPKLIAEGSFEEITRSCSIWLKTIREVRGK